MTTTIQNISRLNYLLRLYGVSREELLARVNTTSDGKPRKNPYTEHQVFSKEIKISILKKVDAIFEKGLAFYVDPTPIAEDNEASVFFRKKSFGTPLNFRERVLVREYEEQATHITTMAKLSDLDLSRQIATYSVSDSPEEVAKAVRDTLYPPKKAPYVTARSFLESFIARLGKQNIFVFEHIEHPTRSEKAAIDGFYIQPNVIVIRRHPAKYGYYKEIFTLAHELGHYLLDSEEIETIDLKRRYKNSSLSDTERWCDRFAFHFLMGEAVDILRNVKSPSPANNYQDELIDKLHKTLHISVTSLYTFFLIEGKMSYQEYSYILEERKKEAEERLVADKETPEEGRKKRSPKPIKSPLYEGTLQVAYHYGLIQDYEVQNLLKIKDKQLENLLA